MDTSLDVIPNPQTKILPENVTNIGDRAIKAAIVNHLLGIIIKDPSAKELLRQAHSDIVGELITLSTKRSDLNIKTILREMDYNLSIHNQNGSSNLTYDREILKELLNSLKLIINAYIKKTTSTDSVPKSILLRTQFRKSILF